MISYSIVSQEYNLRPKGGPRRNPKYNLSATVFDSQPFTSVYIFYNILLPRSSRVIGAGSYSSPPQSYANRKEISVELMKDEDGSCLPLTSD